MKTKTPFSAELEARLVEEGRRLGITSILRAHNCLHNLGCESWDDVAKIDPGAINKIKNCGKQTAALIRAVVLPLRGVEQEPNHASCEAYARYVLKNPTAVGLKVVSLAAAYLSCRKACAEKER